MSGPAIRKRLMRVGWLAVALTVAVSMLLAAKVASDRDREIRELEERTARKVARALAVSTGVTVAQLDSIGALVERMPNVEPRHFSEVTGPLAQAHLAETFLFLRGTSPRPGLEAGFPAPYRRHYLPVHS